MPQSSKFAARTGYGALIPATAKPVSPNQFRWKAAKDLKTLKIMQKVEQYATPEAIFEHTISTINNLE